MVEAVNGDGMALPQYPRSPQAHWSGVSLSSELCVLFILYQRKLCVGSPGLTTSMSKSSVEG